MFKKDPEKVRQYNKKYYQENREKEKERTRKYRELFPDKVKETLCKHREANKEKVLLVTKSWRASNKDHLKEYNKQYKQKYYPKNSGWLCKQKMEYYYSNPEKIKEYRKRNSGKICAINKERAELKRNRIPKCANMEKIKSIYIEAQKMTNETGIPHDVDHIVPLQGKYVSGLHVEWNLQIIPSHENNKKYNHFPFLQEFMPCS
jgi:hypothetical protein